MGKVSSLMAPQGLGIDGKTVGHGFATFKCDGVYHTWDGYPVSSVIPFQLEATATLRL